MRSKGCEWREPDPAQEFTPKEARARNEILIGVKLVYQVGSITFWLVGGRMGSTTASLFLKHCVFAHPTNFGPVLPEAKTLSICAD